MPSVLSAIHSVAHRRYSCYNNSQPIEIRYAELCKILYGYNLFVIFRTILSNYYYSVRLDASNIKFTGRARSFVRHFKIFWRYGQTTIQQQHNTIWTIVAELRIENCEGNTSGSHIDVLIYMLCACMRYM